MTCKALGINDSCLIACPISLYFLFLLKDPGPSRSGLFLARGVGLYNGDHIIITSHIFLSS